MAFRLTHRFLRTLGDGDFGDLRRDFFGFDSGAQIGPDLKYAPFSGAQLGVYRTSDRTIQFQGQYNVHQGRQRPDRRRPSSSTSTAPTTSATSSRPARQLVLSRELGEPRRHLPAAVLRRQHLSRSG